jgi:hypothetical protein
MFGCIKAVSQRKVGCCLAEQRSIGLHSSLISYTIVRFRSVVVSPKLLIPSSHRVFRFGDPVAPARSNDWIPGATLQDPGWVAKRCSNQGRRARPRRGRTTLQRERRICTTLKGSHIRIGILDLSTCREHPRSRPWYRAAAQRARSFAIARDVGLLSVEIIEGKRGT